MHLDKRITKLLKEQAKTLSVAESCTGGLLSNRLTNIPGSTQYFMLGLITYSNESKIKMLKVPSSVLKKYGAVSRQVAQHMAQGVKILHKTDFGIGITGIAGPSGGSKQKPVGLVYIAISLKKKCLCKKFLFKGSRLNVKRQAVDSTLKLLLKFLD